MRRLALHGSPRRLFTRLHRWSGLAVLAVLLIASATGAILPFRDEIERRLEPRLHVVEPMARRASLQAVIDRVEERFPDTRVSTITLQAEPADSLVVYLNNKPGRPGSAGSGAEPAASEVFVNPYTTEILGQRNRRHPVFSRGNLVPMLIRLHYSLLLETPGVYIAGGAAIAWLIMSLIGLALAWPAAWRRLTGWRQIVTIRQDRGSYIANYDLHRTLGVALLPIWLVLAVTSVYLNFPSLVRNATGSMSAVTAPPSRPRSTLTIPWETPDAAIERALGRVAGATPFGITRDFSKGWYSVRLTAPGDINPSGNTLVYVDFSSGDIVGTRLAANATAGDRFLFWQFPLHSGEAFGLPGRVAISAIAIVLVVMCATGLYVWWRGWILRRRERARTRAAEQLEGDRLMTPARNAATTLLLTLAILGGAHAALAQGTQTLAGVIVDQSGGAIPGATITIRPVAGSSSDTVLADGAGAFSVNGLAPGAYQIEVRHELFETTVVRVESSDGGVPSQRIVLKIAGLTESMVVTGRRVETRLSETPQKVELIGARDIERSVASDVTDLLKKNAGVDVVQYNGVLSGIGIRGFRPETSGINKRSLLLVDGRPSGVTNLATLLLDNVDHIEVLKGPASAVYGSSAMGGVVNVITRQSRGPVRGGARVALGSFNASEFAGKAGGNISKRVDFDINGNAFDQRDNYTMGNGVVRPATTYKTYDAGGRLGVDLSAAWRVDGHVEMYRGRDINTPGDVFNGVASQGRKNLEHTSGDARVSGHMGRHLLTGTFFNAQEAGHTSNVTTSNPLDVPYLPYLSFESETGWRGAQMKDAWGWARNNSLVTGLDYEHITSESQSYARTGDRAAPFSADNRKNTIGAYAENTFNLRGGRTVFSTGGRVDRISVETVDTPLKTNFVPSTTTFTVFNPSVGVKQELVAGLRAHATAGRAFVPADAGALTGFTTTIVNGRTQINQGNANLKPERSTSVDAGLEWLSPSTYIDATWFQTRVDDRVVSNVLVSNPPPPDPIILTAVNTLASHIRGMELEATRRVSSHVGAFSNITHYFSRREQLPTTGERNILNVPTNTIRAGVDVDFGHLSTRLAARYVQGRQDQDFNAAGSPVVNYPNFSVADVSATYRIHPRHAVLLTVNNLFDEFYYEKKGYPLVGRSFSLKYRFGL